MKLKRMGLWAIGTGVFIGVGLLEDFQPLAYPL
jgi:hypothetical protein